MSAVEEWVNGKDPDFFSSGLMALEIRWSKCITPEGNYIEKEEVISTGKGIGWLLIDSLSYNQNCDKICVPTCKCNFNRFLSSVLSLPTSY